MRKKIISVILGVILCCSAFTGCALFERNNDKDMQQVIAVIDPITETDSKGNEIYNSGERYIYKRDLNNALGQYAQSYMSNYGMTLQQVTERLLQELITRELLYIEAERLEEMGEIEWTQVDENNKKKYMYSWIDSQLQTLRNDILSGFNESKIDADNTEEEKKSTYPTPDEETTDENYEYYERDENGNFVMVDKLDKNGEKIHATVKDAQGNTEYESDEKGNVKLDADGNPIPLYQYENGEPVYEKTYSIIPWEPSKEDYPCLYGDENRRSLDTEAMRRFVSFIKEAVEKDFKVTDEDRAKFKEDDKTLAQAESKGMAFVYPVLGNTHYLEYLIGKSAKNSLMLTKLQDYIVNGVTVSDEEVVDAYQVQRENQLNNYKGNTAAYRSDFRDGKTTMLYMYDDSCFYVKHILLPFSDEQKAWYDAYKADPKHAGENFTEIRDTQMVNGTVVYPHKYGEDDKSRPMTVQAVFDEISGAMQAVKSNPKEAERLFDYYTYLYSTDPGSFGYGSQYAVERGDDVTHSNYMEEFYYGAIELYDNYKVGEVLPKLVVTDYGVHIMYFSQKVDYPGSIRSINDYLTPGAYKTVYEEFHDTLKTTKENDAFNTWANERVTYYQDEAHNYVHTYEKRYENFYKN